MRASARDHVSVRTPQTSQPGAFGPAFKLVRIFMSLPFQNTYRSHRRSGLL
jgi:hypothetical protein